MWLIPDSESGSRCSSIIKGLADRYQSVSFPPHITLAGVPDWPEDRLEKEMATIAKSTEQFRLPTKIVRCGTSPYQKITLEIEKTPGLNALHQQVDEAFKGRFSKREYPHLSFLYSRLPCDELEQELNEIERLKPSRIWAEQVALVDCNGTPEDWRMVSTCPMLMQSGA